MEESARQAMVESEVTIARLRRIGNSVMLEIPQSMLSGAHICSNTTVTLSLDEETGTLSMRPLRPQYTLDEMLARGGDDAR